MDILYSNNLSKSDISMLQVEKETLCSKGTGRSCFPQQTGGIADRIWFSPVVLRDLKGLINVLKYKSSQGQQRTSNCLVWVEDCSLSPLLDGDLYRAFLTEFCRHGNLVQSSILDDGVGLLDCPALMSCVLGKLYQCPEVIIVLLGRGAPPLVVIVIETFHFSRVGPVLVVFFLSNWENYGDFVGVTIMFSSCCISRMSIFKSQQRSSYQLPCLANQSIMYCAEKVHPILYYSLFFLV